MLLSSVKLRLCSQENSAILKKLVKLRAQKSALLGFSTHADFILEMNMAKSAKKVAIFLGEWLLKLLLVLLSQLGLRPACPPEELARKLKPLGEEERATILRLKEEECHRRNLPFTGDLHAWDMRYYMTQVSGGGGQRPERVSSLPSEHLLHLLLLQVEEMHYSVDQNLLKEYFPMEVVTRGLLDIYQELLGLSFQLVEDAPVWHADVRLYSVTDRASAQVLGQFYLDLYPR